MSCSNAGGPGFVPPNAYPVAGGGGKPGIGPNPYQAVDGDAFQDAFQNASTTPKQHYHPFGGGGSNVDFTMHPALVQEFMGRHPNFDASNPGALNAAMHRDARTMDLAQAEGWVGGASGGGDYGPLTEAPANAGLNPPVIPDAPGGPTDPSSDYVHQLEDTIKQLTDELHMIEDRLGIAHADGGGPTPAKGGAVAGASGDATPAKGGDGMSGCDMDMDGMAIPALTPAKGGGPAVDTSLEDANLDRVIGTQYATDPYAATFAPGIAGAYGGGPVPAGYNPKQGALQAVDLFGGGPLDDPSWGLGDAIAGANGFGDDLYGGGPLQLDDNPFQVPKQHFVGGASGPGQVDQLGGPGARLHDWLERQVARLEDHARQLAGGPADYQAIAQLDRQVARLWGAAGEVDDPGLKDRLSRVPSLAVQAPDQVDATQAADQVDAVVPPKDDETTTQATDGSDSNPSKVQSGDGATLG